MAESRTPRRRSTSNSNSNSNSNSKSSSSSRSSSGSRSSRKSMSGREAIDRVREDFPALLGHPIESVLGLESDDGDWKVTVQVVELARIPHSTDVLGSYTVTLDRNGEVTGYKREHRYYRNQADSE